MEGENAYRVARSEAEFNRAWARFEEAMGGPVAARSVLNGTAEWLDNGWAWDEYIDMVKSERVRGTVKIGAARFEWVRSN